jgi:5-methylcytosine-specific restriction endonuclease McrA
VILAEGQAWKDANRDRVNTYAKEYREKFPEQVKQATAKYRAMHRAVYTSHERKRQAKKLQAMPKWLTQLQHDAIDAIYQMSKRLQSQSGKKMAVDHIVPLQGKNVCGLHVPWNLRVISCSENSVKRAKLTDDAYLPKITSVMIGWSGLPWNWS